MRDGDTTTDISVYLSQLQIPRIIKAGILPVHGHRAERRLSELRVLPGRRGIVGFSQSFEVETWRAYIYLFG